MPVPEDLRVLRRAAVQTLARLSQQVGSPVALSRDSGATTVRQAVAELRARVDQPEERRALDEAFAQWTAATPTAQADDDNVGEEEEEEQAPDDKKTAPKFRVHAADAQLTFNNKNWVPEGSTLEAWWPVGGVALCNKFQTWASEEFPKRFKEKLRHTSLTMEESLRSGTAQGQVHLHAQFTWTFRIDKLDLAAFAFGGVKPHVEVNSARGKDVTASRARAHFYVHCNKVGTLWRFTDYWPFVDYEVNPHWLSSLWAVGKLSHDQYERYLLQCRKSYRGLHQNFEAVVLDERAEKLKDYQAHVAKQLATTRLPFRAPNDSLFPFLPKFLEQFDWAKDRYMIYGLQGPSQAAKTSFTKALFKSPFVVTVQGQETLDLRDFKYGFHDALILDNVNSLDLVLANRALLQSNNDTHRLGVSSTGIYSYAVYLWAVPVVLTMDLDVNTAEALKRSEWLRANLLLDVLPSNAKCYLAGDRPQLRLKDVGEMR